MDAPKPKETKVERPLDPFRRAIIRGLAVLLPPLLTVVIILWVWNTVAEYLLVPTEDLARKVLIDYYGDDILPATAQPTEVTDGIALIGDGAYRRAGDGRFVPAHQFDVVARTVGARRMPSSADDVVRAYIDYTFLQRSIVVPVFLCLFLLLLYLLGKFLAAGIGRLFWTQFERLILRLPLVRNLYMSVKQVTDFMFSEKELEYTRVVAIEYPRKGVWALAFVTGEGLTDVTSAANEPTLTVLIPTSPMPLTGFTIIIKKSEAVDLSLSMEQALQFLVSCGVVAPALPNKTASNGGLPGLPSPTTYQ
jgi:uncharacterized membrane protein